MPLSEGGAGGGEGLGKGSPRKVTVLPPPCGPTPLSFLKADGAPMKPSDRCSVSLRDLAFAWPPLMSCCSCLRPQEIRPYESRVCRPIPMTQ